MKLSVVIPLYVPKHLLSKIDDFIIPQAHAFHKFTENRDVEIIYVANGCDLTIKNSISELIDIYPNLNIKLVWFDKALGFSLAANNGIKMSSGEIVLLFNDDCILLNQPVNYWYDETVKAFENPLVGIYGIHKQWCPYAGIDFCVGYYLALRKKMLDEVGLFDEIFSPGSAEEIDLAARAFAFGWRMEYLNNLTYNKKDDLMVGQFPLYHKGEESFHNLNEIGDKGGGLCEKVFVRNRGILKERRETNYYRKLVYDRDFKI